MALRRPASARNSQNANSFPTLVVDLAKVRDNSRRAVDIARSDSVFGKASLRERITVFGVTKGCAGSVPIAQAMLDGGAAGLADSRLAHLDKLRAAFPQTPLMALRQPMRHEMRAMLILDVLMIISDLDSARALSDEACRVDRLQEVLLMIEAGDGREGVEVRSLPAFVREIAGLPGLHLAGLAINTGCLGGRGPSSGTMALLDRAVDAIDVGGFSPEIISAGNSSCWRLLEANRLAASANHLRLGELILLGRETAGGEYVDGFHRDAFIVRAEVLESADKLGGRRLVCALGCRDTGAGELTPVDSRLRVDRLTSDHTVLTAPDDYPARGGDQIDFIPSYFALQSLAGAADVSETYISYNGNQF